MSVSLTNQILRINLRLAMQMFPVYSTACFWCRRVPSLQTPEVSERVQIYVSTTITNIRVILLLTYLLCIQSSFSVLLIRKHQEYSIFQFFFLEHCHEFLTGYTQTIWITRIEYKNNGICIRIVTSPIGPYRRLSS